MPSEDGGSAQDGTPVEATKGARRDERIAWNHATFFKDDEAITHAASFPYTTEFPPDVYPPPAHIRDVIRTFIEEDLQGQALELSIESDLNPRLLFHHDCVNNLVFMRRVKMFMVARSVDLDMQTRGFTTIERIAALFSNPEYWVAYAQDNLYLGTPNPSSVNTHGMADNRKHIRGEHGPSGRAMGNHALTAGFKEYPEAFVEDTGFRSNYGSGIYRYVAYDGRLALSGEGNQHTKEAEDMLEGALNPIAVMPSDINNGEGVTLMRGRTLPAGLCSTMVPHDDGLRLYDYEHTIVAGEMESLEYRIVTRLTELIGRSVFVDGGVTRWQATEAATRSIRLAVRMVEEGIIKAKPGSIYGCWTRNTQEGPTRDGLEAHPRTQEIDIDFPGIWIGYDGMILRGGQETIAQ